MTMEQKLNAHLKRSVIQLFKVSQEINKESKRKLGIDDMGAVNQVMLEIVIHFIGNLLAQLYINESSEVRQYNLNVLWAKINKKLEECVVHYEEVKNNG